MSNHKAHFRGDIQVDGTIVGPDGQPVGGGSVDWSALVPEINFAGTPGDDTGGGMLSWDDDWYGLTFKGQPGSGDSELYLVNPDDDTEYLNLYSGGMYARLANGQTVSVSSYNGINIYNEAWQIGLGNDGLYTHDTLTNDEAFILSTDRVRTGLVYGGGPGFLGMMLLLDDPTAALNKDIVTSWVKSQSYPRFLTRANGEMHWGDGSAAPDVSLERSGQGSLAVLGQGGDNVELTVTAGDVIVGAHASDGEDAYLEAYTGGTSLVLSGGHVGDADEIYFGQSSWQATMYRHGGGLIGIRESGGGLVLHSPDGTAYKISVANGGALSAVAA